MGPEETRAYVQQRLGLFTRLWGGLIAAAVIFLLILYQLHPTSRPAQADIVHVASAVCCVVLGALWYFGVHRRRLSLAQLYAIDAVNLVLIGTVYGLSAYFSSDIRSAPYTAFIWQTFVVFSRVTTIPSTARRTAAVTALSFVPLLVASFALAAVHPERLPIAPLGFAVASVFFTVIAVILSTTGSRVIYGLRRQITRAMQLGQYTLDEKIGEGGMGVVYRARHAMLRRPAAIKLLRADKISEGTLRRFEREVQQLSRLTHPNTVVVLDYGHSADGVFYYVMEYLEGMDLETLVARHGPQPAARVIHILIQVCGSLEEAHAVGLIHRDIKPANVILGQRGLAPDVAKVVDFGLVKELDAEQDAGETGVLAGTPAYMAPEVVTDAAQVGPRSDLYSLGALAYFLLTGKPVFTGKTLVHVCAQHATEPPIPPSRWTNNGIPAELEALVLACLAKRPDDRPAGARELRLALAALPAARDWDEAAALEWWRAAAARPVSKPATPSQTTVTVDVLARST
jgi:eukaryotic-like serine/threonine-protein kinase